jgi:hypothetical protein
VASERCRGWPVHSIPYLSTAPGVVSGLSPPSGPKRAGRRDEVAVASVAFHDFVLVSFPQRFSLEIVR